MIKTIVRDAAPRTAIAWYRSVRLILRARALRSRLGATKELEQWWDLFDEFPEFRPIQRRDELLRLLQIIRSIDPVRICEIGTASGGTLCALARLARSDATLVTVDRQFSTERRAAFPRFARDRQDIVCVEGDSHLEATRQRLCERLNGASLDLLFIDGDHSYEGVRQDFQMYGPLVRDGGLIVFHDIVPDFKQRYGESTPASTGGVPQFWAELKSRHSGVEEIIEDPRQDGYGLGVLKATSCG
jgi:predicted O-methyltransferase YrrM